MFTKITFMPSSEAERSVLSSEERSSLLEMVTCGTAGARTIRRAHSLLLADEGRTDAEIAAIVRVRAETVAKTRKRFRERGMESLYDRPRSGRPVKLDGRAEAHLVALACSNPPEGRAHWVMQLLANELVTLELVDSVSDETVRRVLKNRRSSLGSVASGASLR